jgi:hypothetical protein
VGREVETGSVIPEVIGMPSSSPRWKPGACHLKLPEDVAGEAAAGSAGDNDLAKAVI